MRLHKFGNLRKFSGEFGFSLRKQERKESMVCEALENPVVGEKMWIRCRYKGISQGVAQNEVYNWK